MNEKKQHFSISTFCKIAFFLSNSEIIRSKVIYLNFTSKVIEQVNFKLIHIKHKMNNLWMLHVRLKLNTN